MTTAARPAGTGTSATPGMSRAAQRALDRRRLRQQRMGAARISGAGKPVRSALLRVPFVVALIVVLAVGIGGVLYLNTKTDESGIRTEQARTTSTQLRLDIEALSRSIADLNATPRIAAEAKALGLVPVGDAAILVVGADGSSHLIGKPTQVRAPSGHAGTGGNH